MLYWILLLYQGIERQNKSQVVLKLTRCFEHRRCALIHINCLIIATTNVSCSIYTDTAVHSRYTLLFVPSIIVPKVSVIFICSWPLCGMQYLTLYALQTRWWQSNVRWRQIGAPTKRPILHVVDCMVMHWYIVHTTLSNTLLFIAYIAILHVFSNKFKNV